MSTVRRSSGQVRRPNGGIDVEKLLAATDADIARWEREEGMEGAVLGHVRFVDGRTYARKVRERSGLSQEAFAQRFGLSLRTIQEWEQRRREPDGPARVLLQVIANEPEAVVRALAQR
jgi:putative transcriptional regulator